MAAAGALFSFSGAGYTKYQLRFAEGGVDMEKVKRYFQGLYEVAAAVNSARATESVLHSIVANVARTMGTKGCSLMLLTPNRKLLLHTAGFGLSTWYLRKGPVSADISISEALEGKPVAVLNATEDPMVQYREQAKREGIASILSVPMTLKKEVIGVVRVYTSEPYQFTKDDIQFVSGVANLGAIALENIRLYDSIKKDYETFREDMLRWRAALGDEWLVQESVTPSQE